MPTIVLGGGGLVQPAAISPWPSAFYPQKPASVTVNWLSCTLCSKKDFCLGRSPLSRPGPCQSARLLIPQAPVLCPAAAWSGAWAPGGLILAQILPAVNWPGCGRGGPVIPVGYFVVCPGTLNIQFELVVRSGAASARRWPPNRAPLPGQASSRLFGLSARGPGGGPWVTCII